MTCNRRNRLRHFHPLRGNCSRPVISVKVIFLTPIPVTRPCCFSETRAPITMLHWSRQDFQQAPFLSAHFPKVLHHHKQDPLSTQTHKGGKFRHRLRLNLFRLRSIPTSTNSRHPRLNHPAAIFTYRSPERCQSRTSRLTWRAPFIKPLWVTSVRDNIPKEQINHVVNPNSGRTFMNGWGYEDKCAVVIAFSFAWCKVV